MDRDEIRAKVIEVVGEEFEDFPKDQITEEKRFDEDFGVDSLGSAELLMAFEEKFDIGNIPDEVADKLKTVGDVVDYIDKVLNQN